MTNAKAWIRGAPPETRIGEGNPESIKYGRMWEQPAYRLVSPGEKLAGLFLEIARPRPHSEVIDFGCGTGRGAIMLAILGQLRVTMVDFVGNCLDEEVRQALTTQAHALRFVKADLGEPLPVAAQYGYCTDVMEHIPDAQVDRVIGNVLRAAQHVFFSISTTEDSCGALIDETLHMTIRPYAWWLEQFARYEAVVHWSQERQGVCFFYVSGWQTGRALTIAGEVNTKDEEFRAHVAHNIRQGWTPVIPHATNDFEGMILGGGPSLNQFEDEIRAKRQAGLKLWTLNGAYNWALERGLAPSGQFVVDGREFNARFTRPVIDECKYLIASQCHPSVFEGLPPDRTYIWHTNPTLIHDLLTAQYPDGWHTIPGGSTVLLRAIPLLRMIGYRRFHLYGCDSCLAPDRVHHAYEQAENDPVRPIPVVVAGRVFWTHAWMASQASEFVELVRCLGSEIELAVYGDGLLAHILTTAADLDEEPTVTADSQPG
jgi:2-polyprenyl-3-methyl-5-hydroxy-6-metoxy-1,4-benzoquinol methylase